MQRVRKERTSSCLVSHGPTPSAAKHFQGGFISPQELPKVEKPEFARGYVDSVVPDDSISRVAAYEEEPGFGFISSVGYFCGEHREDAASTSRPKGQESETL